MLEDIETAVSIGYVVEIDDISLGSFSSCDGLGCEVVMESHEEGGNNAFIWQLPTRMKYPNVKLSRPLGRGTHGITAWFASLAVGYQRRTATIVAMNSMGLPIAHWGLLDVLPVRWSGPTLNSDNGKVVTETLEIAHHGFMTSLL